MKTYCCKHAVEAKRWMNEFITMDDEEFSDSYKAG
jgi:hypothetical protein